MGKYSVDEFLGVKFNRYKERAKSKNRKFKLSFQIFKDLALAPCAYCGGLAEEGMLHKFYGQEFRVNGVDRIDNSKGYEKDNVITACTYCNFAKSDSTLGEWSRWIKRVHEKLPTLGLELAPPAAPNEQVILMDKLRRRMSNADARVQAWAKIRERRKIR